MLTGMFQVCAKQKCSSVSHWFDIILTLHMSKHMRFFCLSKSTERVLMMVLFVYSEHLHLYISYILCDHSLTASMTGILLTRRKPRHTKFRHWRFEKEELFFVS